MSSKLSEEDTKFLNSITENLQTQYNNDIQTLVLHKDISGCSSNIILNKNIVLLKSKFDFIMTDNPNNIDNYLCLKISKFILNKFIRSRDFLNFPQELFDLKFMDFIVKHNLFFKEYSTGSTINTVFNKILSSELNYFNYKFNKSHILFYTDHAKKLKKFINGQLLRYVILNKYEITITINFIKLMANNFEKNVLGTELDQLVYELYENIYNAISNMTLINLESIDYYKKIYLNETFPELENTILYYNNSIKEIKNMTLIKNKLLNNITLFDINRSAENEIYTIAHLCNENTFIGDDFIKFKNTFKPVLLNILKSDKTNIHDKSKIISAINNFDSSFYGVFVKLFEELEKYNNGGIKFKTKLRSKLLHLMSLYPPYSGSQFINKPFITLYSNHINSIMNFIEEIIDELKAVPTEHNKMIFIKYLIYFDQAISYNLHLYGNCNSLETEDLYFFKIIECFYTILESIFNKKIYKYLDVDTVVENFITNDVGCAKYIKKIFTKIFSNLSSLTPDQRFISKWANNSFFYNKNTFTKSIEFYGDFKINTKETVKCILEKLHKNIDEEIIIVNQNTPVFNEEIPDKFKDPILLTIIKNPVEIPSVEVIVDRYTIYNHLIFNKTNPFTNEELSTTELEIYNNKDKVKQRVEAFIKNFDYWKKNHKIN